MALLLLAVLLAGAMGCERTGGGLGEHDAGTRDLERFRFFRVQQILIRLDSASGQVWSAPSNGDGGWVQLGGAPSNDGQAQLHGGRYMLQAIPRRTMAPRTKDRMGLVRFDRSTGRAWLGSTGEDVRWTRIEDASGADTSETEPDQEKGEQRAQPAGNRAPDRLKQSSTSTLEKPPKYEAIPGEKFTSGDPEADVAVVMQALRKEGLPTSMRVWAVRQLGELDPNLAVPHLLEALGHEEPEVVVAAIEALGKTGEVSAIPQILKLENHPDARVREAVKRVVVNLE